MFKGPAVVPSLLASVVGSSAASNTSIFLSGGLRLDSNDFLNLVGAIVELLEIHFAVQSGGTLTVMIPVGKLELDVAGYSLSSVENFLLQVSQSNITLSAEIDIFADWLAKSISKAYSIKFQFSLGFGIDGSLLISIYAVDPLTQQKHPNMSTVDLMDRPFYIPGLVLYPFHFSMRWLADAEEPEAIAAGGGFDITGSQMSNVYAPSCQPCCRLKANSGF